MVAAGGLVLGRFSNDRDGRLALAAVQHYRFTEWDHIGRPQAFAGSRKNAREHRPEHRVVALGQRGQRRFHACQARLDQRQNGADRVGVGRNAGWRAHAAISSVV